jgi:very-short-patch-repair endonuclease
MNDPKEHGLVKTGFHLPYNPKLIDRAREMRKNPTNAEKKLWNGYLRNFQFNFLRQRSIDNYIVDFYCPGLKLVIEIDGDRHFHEDEISYDLARTKVLEDYGLTVIRFTTSDVMNRFQEVCHEIEARITQLRK